VVQARLDAQLNGFHDLEAEALSNEHDHYQHILHEPILLAVDTEYAGPQTLTVQADCRIADNTLAVQVYRSAIIPPPPAEFDPQPFFANLTSPGKPFCQQVIVRPVTHLTPDLSPMRIVQDLLALPELVFFPRYQGPAFLDALMLEGRPRSTIWPIPCIDLTMVMHFQRADCCRVFGRNFFRDLQETHPRRIHLQQGKLIQFAEHQSRTPWSTPIIEYVAYFNRLHAVKLRMLDTMLPFGPGSLDTLAKCFLGFGKIATFDDAAKRSMLQTFCTRAAEAYGYAMVDALITLLIHEQMAQKDAEIYTKFGFEPPLLALRPTLGSRVSTFLLRATGEKSAAGSQQLSSQSRLRSLMSRGGAHLFAEQPTVSRYGEQTGKVQGALLYSRSSTQFWHQAPGMLRDVDMAGCYNEVTARQQVYWGQPVIFEPGDKKLTLEQAVALVSRLAPPDGWLIRVSGETTTSPNALLPSNDNALTSFNYNSCVKSGKRRRSQRRAFQIEAAQDPGASHQTSASRLYARAIGAAVVTSDVWKVITVLPKALRAEYENLIVDSVVCYPHKLIANSGAEYDDLVGRLATNSLPWQADLDPDTLEIVCREQVGARHVALRFPLHEYAKSFGQYRKEAQATYGKGSGEERAWKQHANVVYGVLASRHLPTHNFVAANYITARARAEAFLMSQALNAIQTITDGCSYRLDQIPSCTFAECLQAKPDYPIRRAEDKDGILFLSPAEIPLDDAGFTKWYREHVRRFFAVTDGRLDDLLDTHALAHKLTSKSGSPVFDGLGCDGAGNYLKAMKDPCGGWTVEDFAARSVGKASKEQLANFLVEVYSQDCITEPPPLTEDMELLSFKRAAQQTRAALDRGTPAVLFPLGLESTRVMNYRIIKPSAFVFQTPKQRSSIVKQIQKLESKTGWGLEMLAARRSYGTRVQGSLRSLAEDVYNLIQGGETNLNKKLNISKALKQWEEAANHRLAEIERRKNEAATALMSSMDIRNIDPAGLVTGYVVEGGDDTLLYRG
jgi:hypothetical protein